MFQIAHNMGVIHKVTGLILLRKHGNPWFPAQTIDSQGQSKIGRIQCSN